MDVSTTNLNLGPKKSQTTINYNEASDPFKIQNYDFLNKGYMHDRTKILKEKCKEYIKQTSQKNPKRCSKKLKYFHEFLL